MSVDRATVTPSVVGLHVQPWDLLVVGGGTAGIVGAKTAARLGARVLLVERDRTGGDCLWTGCVPSKALLAAAGVAASARNGHRFGIDVGEVSVDFTRVMNHVRATIQHIAPVDSVEALNEASVAVRNATARFTGACSAEIDGTPVRFRQALIATGASPAVPSVPGLSEVDYLTSDTIWELSELPDDLVVLGGGSIGCELGQAFARLGSRVSVVEGAPSILPREDSLAATRLARALVHDGVELRTGSGVARVEATGAATGVLHLENGDRVRFSCLLVAVGRAPRTNDIGLAAAGVEVDDRGFVVVDDLLRTTNPRIWAAGDLTGHPQFTHTAGVHASLAASNAILGVRRKVDLTTVPRVTFTDPELAAVGLSTQRPRSPLRTIDWAHSHVDRAVAEGAMDGFTRLVVDKRGHILGATVVGPRAGETVGELTLAITRGLTTRDLAGVTHAYPTYNDGPWNVAISDVQDQLERPGTRRALGALARVRTWWVSRDD
ncbi:dihydrolipoyl dehydrogenase family protein [Nocardioides rubriscoriae]|uniref:dihydrolipoyl dehydrogenase family protein n=1 Tax=Nocardioides rubriscoriae TaxID=642762 RepID=UPI00248221D4|nr:FAD-dependent oxidoreductase [Nocardioides rubriscoriae]